MREPTVEDFYGSGDRRSHVGWAPWLRALPYGVPTAVPEELRKRSRAVHVRGAVMGSARSVKVRVKTRTIDGRVWVLRVQE